ncbi:NADP-dependent phosphogluconate dehydrogenase [Thermoflexus sp.]|uniref:NADP-dependent phosphogluconate dehydrogenase n=1 Tax=Thermoflexus sp. TaxID=1969742 RepID=UPI0025F57F93|nr:NADP-dependent phosphogluconate dehydrogenase [Thermoflexus sp.]MDW8180075.1 NADP-dependent phosphogluconate dehydrogenase [Anaerolineae bacterium]MCS6964669.1 NADP-dependent phosphogluconate dehydrogenase [Thermoflexus sp.]MCS7350624.1 NADP-dependent phosphogluconate dehydrogenase [Thermoflexus sp.]MCX7689698.1 NADP-dependent phosphogluconate dehydrogenase [Thermoflexus sp.]MDW8185174.1 NADP-dependent phosphogluconate dehydrogenase [Anaerolineae bacterium]
MDRSSEIGVVGLAVMGQNLALNFARNGFRVCVYNRTPERTEAFLRDRVRGEPIVPAYTIEEFARCLERPRRILLMVQAGPAVDQVIEALLPHLEPGDLVMDGGNSHYADTERRMQWLADRGIRFLGVGISGGEKGALLGPSIMPGGSPEAYAMVEAMLTRIAAQSEEGPCCAYMGRGGAGHYVKMVHNAIEYAFMQGIAEVYDFMKTALGMPTEAIAETFERWNEGTLNAFLTELAARVLRYRDPETGDPLVERILDKAEQKGTGRWAAQSALELGVPTPTLTVAVLARTLSHFKADRERIGAAFPWPDRRTPSSPEAALSDLEAALNLVVLAAFSQGLWLLHEASRAYRYGTDRAEVLRVWRAGCIIRARWLGFLREVVREDPEDPHLLFSARFRAELQARLSAAGRILREAFEAGVPMPALSTAADYVLSMRRSQLPANLIQAQRDAFGAHTYERLDRPGVFHTEWLD